MLTHIIMELILDIHTGNINRSKSEMRVAAAREPYVFGCLRAKKAKNPKIPTRSISFQGGGDPPGTKTKSLKEIRAQPHVED